MQRGLTGDGEFEPMQELMNKLPSAPRLNLANANKHKPFIKRKIQVVKERTCCIRHSLPFASLPPQLVTHVINTCSWNIIPMTVIA